jgi:hypothetical protein
LTVHTANIAVTDAHVFKQFHLKTGMRYRRDTAKAIAGDFCEWTETDVGPSGMTRILKAWGAPYSKYMHEKGYWAVTDMCPNSGSHMEKANFHEPFVCAECSHTDRLMERVMGHGNRRRRRYQTN